MNEIKVKIQKLGKYLYIEINYLKVLDSDASTAKTLTLVAIILQAVFFVIGIFALLFVIAFVAVPAGPGGSQTVVTPAISLGGLIFLYGFALGILWILLEYFLIYKKLSEEKVKEAETPAIVLGIITLIFGGIITGILLIVAYVKIRDSLSRTISTPPIQTNQP